MLMHYHCRHLCYLAYLFYPKENFIKKNFNIVLKSKLKEDNLLDLHKELKESADKIREMVESL